MAGRWGRWAGSLARGRAGLCWPLEQSRRWAWRQPAAVVPGGRCSRDGEARTAMLGVFAPLGHRRQRGGSGGSTQHAAQANSSSGGARAAERSLGGQMGAPVRARGNTMHAQDYLAAGGIPKRETQTGRAPSAVHTDGPPWAARQSIATLSLPLSSVPAPACCRPSHLLTDPPLFLLPASPLSWPAVSTAHTWSAAVSLCIAHDR